MGAVADLDDEYIAKMEDGLAICGRPYDPQQRVVCVDKAGAMLDYTPRITLPEGLMAFAEWHRWGVVV